MLVLSLKESDGQKKKRVTVQGENAMRILQIPHTQAEEAEVAPTAKTGRKVICILFSLRNTKWRRCQNTEQFSHIK